MSEHKKGIYLMLLSSLLFSLMAICVKSLGNFPIYEKIFFRNLIGLFISFSILKSKKIPIVGNNKKLLLLRSILGLLGIAAYFYSLNVLPLADATILNKLSPIFVLIFASVFLSEKIKKLQIPALIISLIGIAMIVKPDLTGDLVNNLIALSSAIFAGGAYTVIRHLRHTDSSESIVFYFCLFSTLAMVPFFATHGFVIPIGIQWIYIAFLGLFATSAQFAITNSYKYAPAGELSIYSYANIIFSTIFGILIWFEIPDSLSLIGGILIIMGGYINYLANKTNSKSNSYKTNIS